MVHLLTLLNHAKNGHRFILKIALNISARVTLCTKLILKYSQSNEHNFQ